MSEEKVSMFKEIEDGYPVFFTRPPEEALFREDHRVIEVEVLNSLDGTRNDIVLKCNQAKYYHFFEKNKDKAYTLRAFIDCYFGVEEDFMIDEDTLEKILIRMVDEGKIKGVYYKSHYYFHL